jgi:8-oxo-dGTP diphosphatase
MHYSPATPDTIPARASHVQSSLSQTPKRGSRPPGLPKSEPVEKVRPSRKRDRRESETAEKNPYPRAVPQIRHCYHCGSSLIDHGPGTHPHCTACGETTWRNSKPTASLLVTDDRGRVLLVRRSVEPRTGWWDVPGGFCEPGELPEAAAIREAREELGVEVRLTAQTGMYTDVYRDETEFTLNIFYAAQIVSGTPVAADDALELRWFGPDELPEQIAFENGRQGLEEWRRRVRAQSDQVQSDQT